MSEWKLSDDAQEGKRNMNIFEQLIEDIETAIEDNHQVGKMSWSQAGDLLFKLHEREDGTVMIIIEDSFGDDAVGIMSKEDIRKLASAILDITDPIPGIHV